MKTIFKILPIALMLFAFTLTSCGEEDTPLPGGDMNTESLYHEDGRSGGPHYRDGQGGDDAEGAGGTEGNRGPIYE